MLTVFFSALGIENLDAEAMKRLVEKEGLISFQNAGQDFCEAALYIDDGENQMWSVNIVVGDDDLKYIDKSIPIFPYSKIGEPNTMLNSTPIRAAHRVSTDQRST